MTARPEEAELPTRRGCCGDATVENAGNAAYSAEQDPMRAAIATWLRVDEALAVSQLRLNRTADDTAHRAATDRLARLLVHELRHRRRTANGIHALMHEFSLSSQEGVALMCVAEALLRIPDSRTAQDLIIDKISQGDWEAHLGNAPSLFVNAATWGLMLTGSVVSGTSKQGMTAALKAVIARGGKPVVLRGMSLAMRLLGGQFVAGRTIGEALQRTSDAAAKGYRHSFDMLGEAALTSEDAQRYLLAYEEAIHAVGARAQGLPTAERPGVSIKLSALHPRYEYAQHSRVMRELVPHVLQLAQLAAVYDIPLHIDAEEADRLELSLDVLEALMAAPVLRQFHGIGFVVQAYQKRAPAVIDYLAGRARRSGRRLQVRLVKGAYWDAEIKRAQESGLSGYPVWTRKAHTDACYLACAEKLLAAADVIFPQFATHNAHSVAWIWHRARAAGVTHYEFQCLYGMGEPLFDQLVGSDRREGVPQVCCRVYAPVGEHASLLAYLVRRLLENGANSSFIHRILDEDLPVDALVADPFEETARNGGMPHPAIPLPPDLFGLQRRNSQGLDLNDRETSQVLVRDMRNAADTLPVASPLLAVPAQPEPPFCITDPASRQQCIGTACFASAQDVDAALDVAAHYAPVWSKIDGLHRKAILERAAQGIEDSRSVLIALLCNEAGRTIPNGVAEVREAVDFLRYYASQIPFLNGVPLGPVACISPWNFPLAIFVGQIAGALAAGNVVLAKPAEQTPLVALAATDLLHEAGVPREALQLLLGLGETVGARLIEDERVRAVLFTGSNTVAASIHRVLSRRMEEHLADIPLVAETGGQNAMIVDSSALPEQVVQDAMLSAFDSAGQRCSALRILCLQEENADVVIHMLRAAIAERSIGHPTQLSTDIGPLIDASAYERVRQHVERMAARGHEVVQMPVPMACRHGSFYPPTILFINSVSEIGPEVFGPVLHVLRYRRERLPDLVDSLNATGYGLTLGIQSRIDATVDAIVSAARVGNVYVNRNMIGAAVGVQPFGGDGLSGTGPKAGGPLYLHRLQRDSVPRLVLPGDAMANSALPALQGSMSGTNDAALRWQVFLRNRQEAWLVERFAQYCTEALSGKAFDLPGPTGERNTLVFVSRGAVLCAASTVAALLHQLCAVIATQNVPWLTASSSALLPPGCPIDKKVWHQGGTGERAQPRFVLSDAESLPSIHTCCNDTSVRIVPVLVTGNVPIPVWRLSLEKTITVNTAAHGGNVSLMTI